jgi:hypothetical protein
VSNPKEDMAKLMALPEFRRFLWRVIQNAGIFSATTNGSDSRYFIAEGRRQLGFSILADAEQAFPVQHPDQIPVLTVIQVLREETQNSQKSEKPNDRYDRTADISDLDDQADGA